MRLCDVPGMSFMLPDPLVEIQTIGSSGMRRDVVPEEVPVALAYNGISHAVMMASPSDLEDFALGFSLSEGLLAKPAELYDLEVESGPQGVIVQMRIAEERFWALKARRRSLAGRTGCGLCGVENLEQVKRLIPQLPAGCLISAASINRARESIQENQPMHSCTGGVHAAAWADLSGRLLVVLEDVGRHNALDKLIGAMARDGLDPASGFALVTSRASFEMVQKAAGVGMTMLAAVSAPTGYAIRLAHECGLTLAGFVRPQRYTIYAHPERIEE